MYLFAGFAESDWNLFGHKCCFYVGTTSQTVEKHGNIGQPPTKKLKMIHYFVHFNLCSLQAIQFWKKGGVRTPCPPPSPGSANLQRGHLAVYHVDGAPVSLAMTTSRQEVFIPRGYVPRARPPGGARGTKSLTSGARASDKVINTK